MTRTALCAQSHTDLSIWSEGVLLASVRGSCWLQAAFLCTWAQGRPPPAVPGAHTAVRGGRSCQAASNEPDSTSAPAICLGTSLLPTGSGGREERDGEETGEQQAETTSDLAKKERLRFRPHTLEVNQTTFSSWKL